MLKIIDFDATTPPEDESARFAATIRLIDHEGQTIVGAFNNTPIWRNPDGTGSSRQKLPFVVTPSLHRATLVVGAIKITVGHAQIVEALPAQQIFTIPGTFTLDEIKLSADAMLRLGIG